MRLLYSESNGVPYISFENGSRLIFSVTTESKVKGFKYMVFSGETTNSVTTSGAKAKRKKQFTVVESVRFVSDMNISRAGIGSLPKEAKKCGLSKITVGFLKKSIAPLLDDDGYFPRENLNVLAKILDKQNGNESDLIDDDPEAIDDDD